MNPIIRRLAAIVAGAAVLAFGVAPVSAQTGGQIHDLLVPGTVAAQAGVSSGGAPDPCADSAYKLLGGKWNRAYRWWFNATSTPNGLGRSQVEDKLMKSFSNVTGVNTDCGLGDNVSASHSYRGRTDRRAHCGQRDGFNVVSFKRLPVGRLAVTCFWISGNRMVEADMQINSREEWALSLAGCVAEPMLEATVTHEAGHVFGLDHVGERKHGRLTMSPLLDGACQNDEATLGLGDVKGLEALY